jgi:hypothetical protein
MEGESVKLRKILSTIGAIAALFLVLAGAANAFGIGNVDGTWGAIDTNGATCNRWATGPGNSPTNISNTSPSIQTPPDTDENQVRYGTATGVTNCSSGTPAGFGSQSGFGFDGNNGPVSPVVDTPFFLGKFAHYNRQVSSSNTFQYANLTTVVPVTCDDGTPASLSFASRFTLDETPNTAPCAYPGTTVCPDKVTITQPAVQTFTCKDGPYTVNILGFTKTGLNGQTCDQSFNSAAVATELITEENADNAACLWGAISAPTADIAPAATCVGFDTFSPSYRIVTTNAGPGAAREAQIVSSLPVGVVAYKGFTSQLTTGSGTVDQGSCVLSGQAVTCQLLTPLPAASVDPAAKWIVDIQVTPKAPGAQVNNITASMTTNDVNTSNNKTQVTCASTLTWTSLPIIRKPR